MKNLYSFLFFLAVVGGQYASAQDIIFKTSGEEINAKVLEINPTKILFTQPQTHGDSLLSLARAEVFMVKYANGEKEMIQAAIAPALVGPEEMSSTQLYQQGRQDAKLYYRGTNAMWGSAGATFLVGLPGTIVIAAIPPKINPREVPNPGLLNNIYYTKGYKSQAHKRKVGKAAIGGGIGLVALVMVFSTLASGQ